MSGYMRRGNNLFNPLTGAWVGVLDLYGNEQVLYGAQGTPAIGTPASAYVFALRASQAGYGALVDQGPNTAIFLPSSGLFPPAIPLSTVAATGLINSPSAQNGLTYVVTTAGTTGASENTAWNTTIGGTTTQGTAIYTTQLGPYGLATDGTKLARSLASSQAGQAATWAPSTAANWDIASDSFMLNLRIKMDWNASGQAAAAPIFSTCLNGTGQGFRCLATGGSLQDLRIQYRTTSGAILSGDTSPGFPRRPFDSTERNVSIMCDSTTRIAYCFVDGVPILQSDMNSVGDLTPNGLNLGALTGSSAGSIPTIGGDPGSATSYRFDFKSIDYLVIKGTTKNPASLPANLQNFASFFARGGEGLYPQLSMQ